MFTVYTYFGRILSQHEVNGLHHDALDSARSALLEYESTTGKPAWIRYN